MILASNELSSGNGGVAGGSAGSVTVLLSPMLACLAGSLLSLALGGAAGALVRISCSRIRGSYGNGCRLASGAGGGASGAVVCGALDAGDVLLLGGTGAR